MKIVAIGKEKHIKLCNITPGTLVSTINSSDLTVSSEKYLVTIGGDLDKTAKNLVNVETGQMYLIHSSTLCILYLDACIVLNPIDYGD